MARTTTMRRGRTGRDETNEASNPSIQHLDNLADWLDTRFSLFGIRFGLDGIFGLIPGVGDVAGMAVSGYLIAQGYRMGARKRTLARMAANVAGDTVFGSIPVLGTIIDVFWKANRANMRLLKSDLQRPDILQRL